MKPNYLKHRKFLAAFFCIFRIRIKFSMFWKKLKSYGPSISEVIDSEKSASLNA